MNQTPSCVHPGWLRLVHWINLLAVATLAMSGWRIYDATAFIGFSIPKPVTIGGWLGGALQWHFAAMWLFGFNGVLYLALNVATGRLRRKFFPLSARALAADVYAAIKGSLSHADLTHYNAVQKLAYLFVMADSVLLVLSGLVLWKSVQFPLLREVLQGYEGARYVHFYAMVALLAFVVVHLVMVALVPRTLIYMVRGR